MNHVHSRCVINWIPAEQKHVIICKDCGNTLYNNLDDFIDEFELSGECKSPNQIGVHVSDGALVRAFFGGKPVREVGEE